MDVMDSGACQLVGEDSWRLDRAEEAEEVLVSFARNRTEMVTVRRPVRIGWFTRWETVTVIRTVKQ